MTEWTSALLRKTQDNYLVSDIYTKQQSRKLISDNKNMSLKRVVLCYQFIFSRIITNQIMSLNRSMIAAWQSAFTFIAWKQSYNISGANQRCNIDCARLESISCGITINLVLMNQTYFNLFFFNSKKSRQTVKFQELEIVKRNHRLDSEIVLTVPILYANYIVVPV